MSDTRHKTPPEITADASADADVVTGLSRFAVRTPIGAGGTAEVFRARQVDLSRDVALKQLRAPLVRNPRIRRAFLSEAMITGRLAHPNIVPIYGVCASEDALAISMKLIRGVSLESVLRPADEAERKRARRYAQDDLIEVLIAVCNAVRFAHSEQILHRDIKPQNIMMGEFGEVLLLDWGLALSTASNAQLAVEQGFPHRSQVQGPEGSPAWMAPEMCAGKGDELGTHSDIYLLGAVLYDIVVGKPPHAHRRNGDAKNKPPRDFYPPPDEGVDGELRAIISRAMHLHPSARYESAAAFQGALRAYLRHQESRRMASGALSRIDKMPKAHTAKGARERFRQAAELTFALRQALLLWPQNEAAKKGLARVSLLAAEQALALGDVHWARDLLQHASDAEGRQLRAQIQRLASDTAARLTPANPLTSRRFSALFVGAAWLLGAVLGALVLWGYLFFSA
ncbi:MAG: serine/threonine protein kinase [Proteobacteria bacterium]|nr:serine/threonine protein kinase [Pseudomonadota bacterium]